MSTVTFPRMRVGIGQASHRFLPPDSAKPCVIAGLMFEDVPGFSADSDGDVVFHAICNAISSVSGVPILRGIARDLCFKDGITDSQIYLERGLETLGEQKVAHVALTIEGKRPSLENWVEQMRMKVAQVMCLRVDQVGLTVISGEGLTDFGCGDGLQCLCVLTVSESV